jgi:hypothetical protein
MLTFESYIEAIELTDEELIEKGLSIQGRRSLARSMKKNRFKLARSRKIQSRKRADSGRIKNRARRQARSDLFKKLSGGKSRSSVTVGRKKGLERRMANNTWKRRISTSARMQMAPKRRADRRT